MIIIIIIIIVIISRSPFFKTSCSLDQYVCFVLFVCLFVSLFFGRGGFFFSFFFFFFLGGGGGGGSKRNPVRILQVFSARNGGSLSHPLEFIIWI